MCAAPMPPRRAIRRRSSCHDGPPDAGALAATHAAAFSDDRPWSQAEIAALLDQAGTS